MSSITNIQTAKAPQNRLPEPMRNTAERTAPTVPVIVIMSGVTPARSSAGTIGATTLATAIASARSPSPPPSPRAAGPQRAAKASAA